MLLPNGRTDSTVPGTQAKVQSQPKLDNKFAKDKIFITIKSDSNFTEIIIEDDGEGYPRDVLNKIGEPYITSYKSSNKVKSGLGLGIFIGKTLLEKNYANISCKNSQTKKGAEVNIKWNNKDLLNV